MAREALAVIIHLVCQAASRLQPLSSSASLTELMPVNRTLIRSPITKSSAPAWVCPTCAAGMLRLDTSSLSYAMSSESARASDEEWFGAQHVEYRFIALLKCDNTACREVAPVAGMGEVDETPDEQMEQLEYEEQFFPTFFQPSPILISIPARCPAAVREQLHASFSSSWTDANSAANRIRVAVELLLDSLRIARTRKTKTGRRHRQSLHERIDALPPQRADIKDLLLAIKWLGNYGTHETNLTQDSVYDALDIFEVVLTNLYSEHPRRIKQLVKVVNKRRGPMPRTR